MQEKLSSYQILKNENIVYKEAIERYNVLITYMLLSLPNEKDRTYIYEQLTELRNWIELNK